VAAEEYSVAAMKRTLLWLGALMVSLAAGVATAQVISLTGTWYLNVEKSQWGSMRKPASEALEIQHREPALQYHGTVTYSNEETRDFAFEGSIDGKEYAMTRSFGTGTITLRRTDPFTIESIFKTTDGAYVENARTIVSRDGKTLTRRLRTQSPEGVKTWTEIWERR